MRTRRTPGEALVEQGWALHDWFAELDPSAFSRPTVLPGWDTRDLLAHLDQRLEEMLGLLAGSQRDDVHRERTDSPLDSAAAPALLDRLATALERAAADLGSSDPAPPVDVVATCVVELVVHADDLTRTFGDREPVPLGRPALGVASRTLANLLAARYPGRSVEVRIPPYAAVQCSAVRGGVTDPGPTHTRGTPPNVVETDAVTFFRLCTGRTSWAAALASGVVAASGLRADLSEMVPLLT